MDILFENSRIKKICNNARGRLKTRLDDISAAANMAIMKKLPGRLHPLKGVRKGEWAIDLEHPQRLILEPVAAPLPLSEDGWLDLEKISAIRILEIVDYHD